MAVRNAGAPRLSAADPVTPVIHALHARPPATLAWRPARPSACLLLAPHANTAPSVFVWQRRPSRWAPRRSPRRSPSRSRCVMSASLGHPPAPHPFRLRAPIPEPAIHTLTLSATTATPGEGAERRQRALLPRGHQGLHRRPQRLRLQDRPLELEPHPHGGMSHGLRRELSPDSGLRTARDRTQSSRTSVSCPVLCVCAVPSMPEKMDRFEQLL